MFTGRSMGKAYRPSRYASIRDPVDENDTPQERETRIRAYARRVRLRLPVFAPKSDVPAEVARA